MGRFAYFSAFLSGFFAFGAIYHLVLWSRSRRDWASFLFAALCIVSSINSTAILAMTAAVTVAAGQRALNLRVLTAAVQPVLLAWLFTLVAAVRAPRWLWLLATAPLAWVVGQLAGTKVVGVVTGLSRLTTPWGETITVLTRADSSPLLIFIYALGSSVCVVGLVCARRLWAEDRVGGALVAFTALGYAMALAVAFSVDLLHTRLPYVGPALNAVWILPIAWQVARGNAQRDAELLAANQRFRAIFDHTFGFIGLLSVDGTVVEANQTALDFAGVRKADVVGQPFWETRWWEHSPALQHQLRDAIRVAAGGEDVRFEATHSGPDGRLHSVDFSLKPVRDAAGRIVLLLPEGRDVTALKEAEAVRWKLEQQLLQSQKMEALGQLAGGVAHDFNNLLTVVAGHTDLLLAESPNGNSRPYLGQIRLACERAAALTRQLLAFSRQSVLAPKRVNLNAILEQTEAMLRKAVGGSTELTISTDPDVRPMTADPDQITRVLLNLALNARDAMPGGGRLRVETRQLTIENDTASAVSAKPGDYVRLTVSDSGCGMTADIQSRIFEPFYSTKELGRGTGLGLAVVDGIVKQSGGYIDVESEVGQGTTFTIYLPVADGDRALEDDGPQPASAMRGVETVLLVDDVGEVREMVGAALTRFGYTVLAAADAAEALAIAGANRGRIDLVVSDVAMPGMSGPQLVERLRAEAPTLRVVFMSGYAPDAAFRQSVQADDVPFLQKPFGTGALVAKVRQALDRGQ